MRWLPALAIAAGIGVGGWAARAGVAQSANSENAISLSGWVVQAAPLDGGGARLDVDAPTGRFPVIVSADMVVRDTGDRGQAPSWIVPGSRVEITGVVTLDATVQARTLRVSPPTPLASAAPIVVRGRAAVRFADPTAAGGAIWILRRATGDLAVHVGPDTAVSLSAGLHDVSEVVHVGDAVAVWGRGDTESGVWARRVVVEAPTRPTSVVYEGTLRGRAPVGAGQERWLVDRVSLTLGPEALPPAVEVGDRVRIVGRSAGASLTATEVWRLDDAEELVVFRGSVAAIEPDTITVDGAVVAVDADTLWHGAVAAGAFVEVQAVRGRQGRLLAREVHVVEASAVPVEFEGTIERAGILGAWTIDGQPVIVDGATAITGLPPAPGMHAEVTAVRDGGGALVARHINVQADPTGGTTVVLGTLVAGSAGPGVWRLAAMDALDRQVEIGVTIDADTVVDESRGVLQAGAVVEVSGRLQTSGNMEASLVRVRR